MEAVTSGRLLTPGKRAPQSHLLLLTCLKSPLIHWQQELDATYVPQVQEYPCAPPWTELNFSMQSARTYGLWLNTHSPTSNCVVISHAPACSCVSTTPSSTNHQMMPSPWQSQWHLPHWAIGETDIIINLPPVVIFVWICTGKIQIMNVRITGTCATHAATTNLSSSPPLLLS